MEERRPKPSECVYFRDNLRDARAAALRDVEGFAVVLRELERLGFFLCGESKGLGHYFKPIRELALRSPLAVDAPSKHPDYHPAFGRLYRQVREGRNQAAHEGAFARHLTQHVMELSLIIEDALNQDRL